MPGRIGPRADVSVRVLPIRALAPQCRLCGPVHRARDPGGGFVLPALLKSGSRVGPDPMIIYAGVMTLRHLVRRHIACGITKRRP